MSAYHVECTWVGSVNPSNKWDFAKVSVNFPTDICMYITCATYFSSFIISIIIIIIAVLRIVTSVFG